MSFFDGGNLITLAIMALALILYHQLTRRNTALDKARKYARQLKDDLAVYTEEKSAKVRDYGIALDVEQKAAKELLSRLQLTGEDLKGKADAIARIDERISGYDAPLEELVRMTSRVQENLNRLRDESAFVETAVKRVTQAEGKLKGVELELQEMQSRFERESADALEQASEAMLAGVRSTVSDLQATAETIERKVEDHREAVNLAEKQRAEILERDLDTINVTLERAIAQAEERADKLEDEALVKFREQALDRVQRFHDKVEEKLKGFQEASKGHVVEVQGLLRELKDGWKAEHAELEAKEQAYKDEIRKNIAELDSLSQEQRERRQREAEEDVIRNQDRLEALKAALDQGAICGQEQIAALEAALAEASSRISEEAALRDEAIAAQYAEREQAIAARNAEQERIFAGSITDMEDRIHQIQDRINGTASGLEELLANAVAEAEAKAQALAGDELEKWRQASAALEAQVRGVQNEIADSSSNIENILSGAMEEAKAKAQALAGDELEKWQETIAQKEARVRDIRNEIAESTSNIENILSGAMKAAKTQAQSLAEAEFEHWRLAAEEGLEAWKQTLSEQDSKARQFLTDWQFSSDGSLEQWQKAASVQEAKTRQMLAQCQAAAEDTARTIAEEAAERDEALTAQITGRNAAIAEAVTTLETRVRTIQEQITDSAANMEQIVSGALEDAAAKAEGLAGDELEKWRTTADECFARWQSAISEEEARTRQLLADWKAAAEDTARTIADEAAAQEQAIIAQAAQRDQAITAQAVERDQALATQAAERDRLIAAQAAEWKAAFAAQAAGLEDRVRTLREQIGETASRIETQLADVLDQAEEKAQSAADQQFKLWQSSAEGGFEKWQTASSESFEAWRQAVSDADERTQRILADLESSAGNIQEQVASGLTAMEVRLKTFEGQSAGVVEALETRLIKTTGDMEQKVLEANEKRLEQYRSAQAQQLRNLDSLAEDTTRLDNELRRYMQETESRVRQDFAAFERTSYQEREAAAEAYAESVNALRSDLSQVEQELAALKTRAMENVSDKLHVFEDDFAADLAKRGESIDQQLGKWKADLDENLAALNKTIGTERQQLELSLSGELKRSLAEQQEQLTAELERIQTETAAYEAGIQKMIDAGDQSLEIFKAQIEADLAQARSDADASVKAELGNFALSMADSLKQAQKELAQSLKELAGYVSARGDELSGLQDASHREIEDWQIKTAAQMKNTDALMEEVRRKAVELVTESDERLAAVRAAIEAVRAEADTHRTQVFSRVDGDAKHLDTAIAEANRELQDFITQTKLFEQAASLKAELDQRIAAFRSDLDQLDQRRAEAAELEGQFAKIRRLEDEVNNKMTRFLSEQRRLESMETDFNRLLQTSQAVEEKLTQVSASDDTLQALQVQIRKFDDALTETEAKYQRIEKKNQTLETTTQAVDRNFKALQDTEAKLKEFIADTEALSKEQAALRASIDKLAAENEAAQAAADKLSLVDQDLSTIEVRLKKMDIAREWVARAETRLEDLNKAIQDRGKLIGDILKDEGASVRKGKGAPTAEIQKRVIELSRMGWKVEEISRSLQIGRGEVELILELGPKG
ncbi:hypothetical protein AGMMS49991_07340 [Spirochaetia bacterium]|nr:hypothetical protein AGMMS49991_07340 [Spirochaetia bacterium]